MLEKISQQNYCNYFYTFCNSFPLIHLETTNFPISQNKKSYQPYWAHSKKISTRKSYGSHYGSKVIGSKHHNLWIPLWIYSIEI